MLVVVEPAGILDIQLFFQVFLVVLTRELLWRGTRTVNSVGCAAQHLHILEKLFQQGGVAFAGVEFLDRKSVV